MVLTSSESDQYSSAQKEISKLPFKYIMGYFCRSVYYNFEYEEKDSILWNCLFFYSRFDWEDKLLEKTIKTDIKLDQHMTKLEETIKEMHEWKIQFIAAASNLQRATYTRWGRTTCPGNGSESVYDGFAGGSHYTHKGGASSMLCLPKDPDWEAGKTSDKADTYAGLIYGAEYEDNNGRTDQLFGESHQNRDVPCVVCDVTRRSTVLMIPGRSKCHAGWTLEYTGYLMAGYYSHAGGTDYYCVDKDPVNLPGGLASENGFLLYFVEARCGPLRCQPYVNGREFHCAVCTK